MAALAVGYRLIDTAQRYGCEERLGAALQEAALPRDQLFLTDKVWPEHYGLEPCLASVAASLAQLGTDTLDLLLLHWPGGGAEQVAEAWRALELLLERGTVRAIGVSNFQQRHLDRLLATAAITPHVNQVEFHPYQQDRALLQHCAEPGVQVEGWSPLGKGRLLGEPAVVAAARGLGVTPAQVLVRWSIEQGVVTIPKSTKAARVVENWAVWHFELGAGHRARLDSLHRGTRVSWDPDSVP